LGITFIAAPFPRRGGVTMPMRTLEETFDYELADVYDAEHQFRDAEARLQRRLVRDAGLSELLYRHAEETKTHVTNLEKAFKILGKTPQRQPCDPAWGLVNEAWYATTHSQTAELRDLMVADAASRVESFEIQGYQALLELARRLKLNPKAVVLMERNLKHEQRMAAGLDKGRGKLLTRAFKASRRG
jgi:ferritin-like metal-binding protein YciE